MNCNICEMDYMPENPDDVRQHDEYHDKVVNGLCAIRSSSDIVVWSKDNLKITVVANASPVALRRQAEEVGRFARRDARYDAEVLFGELETNVFLLQKDDRIVGFLLVDSHNRMWQVSWGDFNANKINRDQFNDRPIWCIGIIWVLAKWRGSGYAKLILEEAVKYLNCDIGDIAWYVPPLTELGKTFMQSCCPREFNISRYVEDV